MKDHWSTQFVGKQFADHGRGPETYDCWGLVRAAMQAATGVTMPSFADDYVCSAERSELDALIAGERGTFEPIDEGKEKPLDLALFRIRGWRSHIGIVTSPGRMLHVGNEEQQSCIESYRTGRWAPKLEGFYRYAMETKDVG